MVIGRSGQFGLLAVPLVVLDRKYAKEPVLILRHLTVVYHVLVMPMIIKIVPCLQTAQVCLCGYVLNV